jgi:glycosyltransferase involved in cell wall biosynthesis
MKILYVTSYYTPAYVYGGPVKSVSSMCKALSSLGAEVTVFTTNANGMKRLEVPLEQEIQVDGVKVYYYPVVPFPARNYFYCPKLAQACKKKTAQYDLVVLETLYTHAMGPAVAACLHANVRYIVPLRGQLLPWALRQKKLKKYLYLALRGRPVLDRAAALHCTDHGEAEAAASLGLRSPAFIVPNGVDASRFCCLPERGGLRRDLGIPMDAASLLFLGRLHRKKRPDIAVEALAASQGLTKEVHLVLAGPDDDGLAPLLKAQAQRTGCASHLHITGLLQGDEVLQALTDTDLLLMPSEPQSENFGMSAIEALAAGLPILASEGVPVGRWAEEAGAGLVAPCRSQDFARATRDLLSKPDKLQKMGEQGSRLVKERFDLPVVARQMLAQFKAVITTGKPLPY